LVNKIKIKFFFLLLILIISCLFIVGIYKFPNDWFGWFLVVLTFIIPLLVTPFNRNGVWIITVYIILTVYHSCAFINSYITPTLGADKDAIRFIRNATSIAENSNFHFKVGAVVYENFLALIFKLFGASTFLASELSVVMFLMTLIVLLFLAKELKMHKYIIPITLLFGFLPSVILFTSVPLRESYQMFFFSSTVFFALKFINSRKYKFLIISFLSLFLLGITHNGLIVAVPFLLLIILLYSVDSEKRKFSVGIKILLMIIFLVLISGAFVLLEARGISSNASKAVLEGDILEYAGSYSSPTNAGRSAYNVYLDTSNPLSIILTLPIVFLSYMFAPFPWQIRGLLDIYAFFESLLRLILVISIWKTLKIKKGFDKKKYVMVLLLVIILEVIWSTGTQNWGTAMRHHLPAYGAIVVLGVGGLLKILRIEKVNSSQD